MARKKIDTATRETRDAPLSLKVRPSLKAALKQAADQDGRTLAQFTERLLEAAMREQGFLK